MKRLENYQKPCNNDTHGYDGPIAISNGGQLTPVAQDFLRASHANGIPFSGMLIFYDVVVLIVILSVEDIQGILIGIHLLINLMVLGRPHNFSRSRDMGHVHQSLYWETQRRCDRWVPNVLSLVHGGGLMSL